MARIETWFDQDLKKPVKVRYIDGNVFSQDNNGNVIGVNVYDNGEAAALAGTVAASIIRADGVTVAATGTLSGNKVSVVLPQTAYAVPGVLSIVLKITSGSDVTTLCAVIGNVYMSSTDSIVDPGTIIPSIDTLIAEINAAVASIPADYSSLWTSLAPAFSASKAYTVWQYVTYNGGLYRFKVAHPAGTWDNTHVVHVSIGNDISDLKRALTITHQKDIFFTADRAIWNDGTVHITSGGYRYATVDYIPIAEGAKITYQLETGHQNIAAIAYYDKDKLFIGGEINTGASGTQMESVIPENCKYVRFSTRLDIITYVDITPGYHAVENAAFISSKDKNIPQSIGSVRRNLPTSKEKVQLPSLSFMSNYSLNVYTDGYTYDCLTELKKFKNASTNVHTVRNSTELANAITNASAGDTIYFADGVYEITRIEKSLNLIAQNKGNVYIVKKDIGNVQKTATTGIYKYSISKEPISAYYKPAGKAPIKLTKTNDTGTTTSTPGSFNYSSELGLIYVHLPEENYPGKFDVFVDTVDSSTIIIRSNSNIIKLYLEGINVWGNGYALYADSGNGGTIDVIAVDCCFWHSNKYNVVSLLGANGYFQRCEAAYGYRDGFNYHANTSSAVSCGLEIDCIAHDNGTEADPQTEESNNGSTTHDGGKCIRINGYYYRNYGGNIAETNSGTESYNYGCVAFDSRASDHHPTWKGDFWCADSAVQYAYGCRCIGDSTYGLDGIGEESVIYYDKFTETGEKNGNTIGL